MSIGIIKPALFVERQVMGYAHSKVLPYVSTYFDDDTLVITGRVSQNHFSAIQRIIDDNKFQYNGNPINIVNELKVI